MLKSLFTAAVVGGGARRPSLLLATPLPVASTAVRHGHNPHITHVRRRAPTLAVEHEDPNACDDNVDDAWPPCAQTSSSTDPNAALAKRFDLATAIPYRNTGTAHHPLTLDRAHVRAPTWDMTVDARGVDARVNGFAHANDDKWKYLNDVVWPRQCVDVNGERKKAEVFYHLTDVKYSPRKLWTVCEFVRGRAVDDALVQLAHVPNKGAIIMTEALNEAKALARTHDIEYPSNTWIAEVIATESRVIKGGRRVKGSGVTPVRYRYASLYIRLEEGAPPAECTRVGRETGWSKMAAYIQQLRERKIRLGL